MSSEKTELPTKKKLRESAEKGQSYKSRDIIAAVILAAGLMFMLTMSFADASAVFIDFLERGNNISPDYAGAKILELFIDLTLPFVGVCIAATVIPSLLQSKFILAFEAVKIDFNSLNPVSGFQKIFSLKTVKEFVKAILYLILFCAISYLFYNQYRNVLYSLVNVQASSLVQIWLQAGVALLLLCLGAFLLIIVLDGFVEYYLYIKELKMEKHEVKQEFKEQEGNPEVKFRRKEVHQEILSDPVKRSIDQSDFILANPTHIAIGIYTNFNISPDPFISVIAKNQVALAVIAYAEKRKVPIVRDIPLARRLFKEVKLYKFAPKHAVEPLLRILRWLKEVEAAQLRERGELAQTPEEAKETTTSAEASEMAKESATDSKESRNLDETTAQDDLLGRVRDFLIRRKLIRKPEK